MGLSMLRQVHQFFLWKSLVRGGGRGGGGGWGHIYDREVVGEGGDYWDSGVRGMEGTGGRGGGGGGGRLAQYVADKVRRSSVSVTLEKEKVLSTWT
jgi:hypothetical protein